MESEDVEYCVVLKEGERAEKRREFYASKEAIEENFKSYTFAGGTPGTKHVIEMVHIIFEGNPADIKDYIKKTKKSAKAEFIEGELGSLELTVVGTGEDAIKCLKCLKLR